MAMERVEGMLNTTGVEVRMTFVGAEVGGRVCIGIRSEDGMSQSCVAFTVEDMEKVLSVLPAAIAEAKRNRASRAGTN